MPIVIRFLHASRRLGAKMCIFMTGVSNQPAVFCRVSRVVSHKYQGAVAGVRMQRCRLYGPWGYFAARCRALSRISVGDLAAHLPHSQAFHKTHMRIN